MQQATFWNPPVDDDGHAAVPLAHLNTPAGRLGLPAQSQLEQPLLEVLQTLGGSAITREVYEAVADRFNLTRAQREAMDPEGKFRIFDRELRWAKQKLDFRGMVRSPNRGLWELTERGKDYLLTALPGVIIPVMHTPNGVVVWGDALAIMGYVHRGQVQLGLVSPPYPYAEKLYGIWRDEREYLDHFMRFYRAAKDCLTDSGSMVVNLGLHYEPGHPALSLYQHDFVLRMVREEGWYLAGEHQWVNPAKLPAPAGYVNVERIRCKIANEYVFWFGKTARPKANNRNVLEPYSEAMLRLLAQEQQDRQHRPSGHSIGQLRDNGGSIPTNILTAANTASNSRYRRLCQEAGIEPHPATFPEDLPEFWVRFTTDPGDLVMDFTAGSLTTGAVTERLGRRWICMEQNLRYIQGGAFRFDDEVPVTMHPLLHDLYPTDMRTQYRVERRPLQVA